MGIFISTKEAVRETGLSANTIRQLCKDGHVDSLRIGSNLKVKRESLLEYLDNAARAGKSA